MYSLEKITLLSLHFIIGVFYFIPALKMYFILSTIKSASESEDECDYSLFKASGPKKSHWRQGADQFGQGAKNNKT